MSFWEVHGVFFLICMFFFPRLTLIFSSVPIGGCFWWLGWLFVPRFLVAILATISYWDTNPFLVFFTWIWALSGEPAEKHGARTIVVKKAQYRVRKDKG